MGANCFCMHGNNSDGGEVYVESPNVIGVRIQQGDLSTESKTTRGKSDEVSPKSQKEEQLEISPQNLISDLMKLQNILRGFHDRRTLKKSIRTSLSSDIDQKELPTASKLNEITDYTLRKMKEFQYEETNNSVPLSSLGPIKLTDNCVYTGEWNQFQQRHGKGIQKWPNGSVYEGHWQNDQMHGKGRLVNSKGDIYDGDWNEGKRHGIGKLIMKEEGIVYEGEWENGKKEGFGSEQWDDSSSYLGYFKNGLKHGHGLHKWDDGRIYEGDWCEDKMHGQGTFTWTDNRQYIGSYVDDVKHGYGVFLWPDGRKYEGNWQYGKQHGFGVYYNQSGKKREGQWENGKRIRRGETASLE